MDVQKYIKRLKFARADWSRDFGRFTSREQAVNFLNTREFFFGDPFVVMYTESDETKLMLAIGKSTNPEITADTTEVTGGVGPEAYELFDFNEFRDAIEELEATTSGLTEDVRELYELIETLTGSTSDLIEIIGSGWTDSPTNVTITDRLLKDEELMKIVWEFNHGGSGVFEPRFNEVPIQIDYDATHNRIRLVAGEAATEYIQLNGAAEVFTRIEYVPEEEVIRFWYIPSGNPDPGVWEHFDIDVHALIEEWETENTDTVELNRERVITGKDILTANVKISEDEDNMLTVVGDGLKVEDVRPAIQEIQEHIEESDEVTAIALNRLAEAIDTNANGLVQERNERIGGDFALGGQIAIINARINDPATGLNRLAEEIENEKGYRKAIKLARVNPNDYASLGIGDDVREAFFVTYHMPGEGNFTPYSKPQPGDEIIKIYKDSVIYKIYFGHVDDTLTSPTDPTVVPGTGDTAICFIYFDAEGHYALATNKFDDVAAEIAERLDTLEGIVQDEQEVTAIALNRLAEAIMDLSAMTVSGLEYFGQYTNELSDNLETLADAFNESEEVTARALNVLAEGVVQAKTAVELESGTHHITLDRTYGPNGEDIYIIGEHHIAGQTQVDAINNRLYNTIDRLDETNNILDNIKVILNTAEDGHFTARFIGPRTSTAETYYDAINALDGAVDEAAVASRVVDFVYDSNAQDLVLTYTVNGAENTKRVDVSDFVKDSFLEGVQIVTHDGVQCLEFSFRTYDGQPLPIYVPLSDLAVLYSAGDGIDRDELENQVITVKIDEFARKNYLAKSANGLLVTGVTEEIQEAVAAEAQARQEEDQRLWDALNQEISARTAADEELQEEIDDIMSSLSAFTADTIVVNDLTAITANIENLYAENAQIDNLTAHTIYADEYQNLPTATTEQYGVVILDDHLDSGSTHPVMNSAVTMTILENEETTAAALNDLNDRKANRSELQVIENDLHNNYYNKAEVDELFDEFEITVDDHLDSASTNPVENRVLYQIIVDDEEAVAAALNDLNDRKADTTYVDAGDQNLQEQIDMITEGGLTGVRVTGDTVNGNVITNIEKVGNEVIGTKAKLDLNNITAQTINTSAFTATTANIDNLTANTIVTNQITGTTANFTGVTANTLDVDNITAQTILTNTITGNTANFTGMTATTISAATYNNLPTASTTNYGMVILDDHLDSASTHAVMNSAITQTILENEEITAAALNDLNDRINNIRFDVDDHLDSASTNPVENRVLYQIIVDDEEAIAAALNDLNDRKADQTDVTNLENRVTIVEEAIETIAGGGLTGVTTTNPGGGNCVGSIVKDGLDVKATLISAVTANVFNTYTASTQTDVSGKADKSYVDTNFVHSAEYVTGATNEIRFYDASGNTLASIPAEPFIKDGMVESAQVSGTSLVITFNTDAGHTPISIPLSDIFNPNNYYTKSEIDAATASTLTGVTAVTATTAEAAQALGYVSKIEKDGQKVKSTVTPFDTVLNTGSTNAVQNKVITETIIQNELITAAALNDLNDRKANIEDVPVTINDLDGAGDLALKTDLAGFLPLSGGTMTGNISGSTGNAIYMPGGFFQQSDERLKIFMGDIENALDKANNIPTKYFYWKDRYDGPRELGTSAQKVQELFPEIVSGDDKLSVDYSKLAIVALAAIKELTAKVEDLQNQLDEFKK